MLEECEFWIPWGPCVCVWDKCMMTKERRRNNVTKVFFQTFHMFFLSGNNAIIQCNDFQPCGPSMERRWTIYWRLCPGSSLLIICTVNPLSCSRTFLEAEDEVDSHFHCTSVGLKLPCQRGCWWEETVYSASELKPHAEKLALKVVL